MTDQEALDRMRNGDDSGLIFLYRKYRAGFIRSIQGKWHSSQEDALGLYHEVMLVFVEKVKNGQLVRFWNSGLIGWLVMTGNNLLRGQRRDPNDLSKKSDQEIDPKHDEAGPEEAERREAHLDRLEWAIEQLDERCRELIVSFHLNNAPLTSLWKTLGYPSYNAAKTALNRCRERLGTIFFNDFNAE